MLVALLMGAATLVAQRGAHNLETQLWVGILCLQCIPYIASILSVGLAHAIARGVFAGLVKKKGVFVVTPKGWHGGGALAFFNPIREEIGLLVALLMGAATLVAQRGAANLETQLWVGILCLQCIPYLASILCQVAAYMPERKETAPACALPGKA